jgi:drug/metabolite transporter (DMT)-like permease
VFDVRTLLGFAAMIGFTVAANLMLKIGAMDPPEARWLFGVLGWKSAAGLCLFGFGGVIYAVVLRAVPLNVAQMFTAAQFIGVVLAASVVLGEPIPLLRWFGIICACIGILVIGLTASA